MPPIVIQAAATLKKLYADVLEFCGFHEAEPLDYPFAPSDVAELHRVGTGPDKASLDDQTWDDLLLPRYLEHLSGEVSIFGRQALYRRLRDGLDAAESAAAANRLKVLMDDPAAAGRLRAAMRPLRSVQAELAALLFEGERVEAPGWLKHAWLLPLALVASIAAVALSPAAWLAAGFVLYLLMTAQMRYHQRVTKWSHLLYSLQTTLRVTSQLGTLDHPLLAYFAGVREESGRFNHALSRSSATIPGAGEYGDWFALSGVKHYFKTAAMVFEQREFLREAYLACANLEADLALARHLLRTPSWCWSVRRPDTAIVLEDGVHPLLEQAAPLSISIEGKGAFISGQNGIGKSTFLRMLGLNLVVARAFGFCYAAKAELPPLPVYASMQSADSLLGGESLYMAELRRARELLEAADGPHPGICIIDEIFRGTNHLESVSAAAAVLDMLASKGLVVVSSHNLVLAPLLEHRLSAYSINADAHSGLALAPGVLSQTNGVALLGLRGFDSQVEQRAGKVSRWLSAYLAHPFDGVDVLVEEGETVV